MKPQLIKTMTHRTTETAGHHWTLQTQQMYELSTEKKNTNTFDLCNDKVKLKGLLKVKSTYSLLEIAIKIVKTEGYSLW